MARRRKRKRNIPRDKSEVPTSKLEDKFETILNLIGLQPKIHYERQYYVKDVWGYFDFKIKRKNILIEVDGDYWHCNPDTKHKKPITEAQKRTLIKDKMKNDWCRKNKVKLLRFWETEINEEPEKVIVKLKKAIFPKE